MTEGSSTARWLAEFRRYSMMEDWWHDGAAMQVNKIAGDTGKIPPSHEPMLMTCPDHGVDHNSDNEWHHIKNCNHAWTTWRISSIFSDRTSAYFRVCRRCGDMEQRWSDD